MADMCDEQSDSVTGQVPMPKMRVRWRNVALFAALHVGAIVGLYQLVFLAQWKTIIWTMVLYHVYGLGITMGAHRLWAHRSYKARLPLRIALMIANCGAFQNDIMEWARDHRGHHKWSDTPADPHNSQRGFFFTHMGWLLVRKHPLVIEKGRTLDLSDLHADPVCQFQHRFYLPLVLLFCFIVPTVVPVWLWSERALVAFYTAGLLRYCVLLHGTWMVNSVAHTFGYRPYDKNIKPRQSVVTSIMALGEGWHNYHHTFPYDYKTSEIPYLFNMTTVWIDVCSSVGLAYDLKSAPGQMIESRKARTGDDAHE